MQNVEVTSLATKAKRICKKCFNPLTLVGAVAVTSNKQEAPSYILNHGDNEEISVGIGTAKDMIV